MNIRYLAALAAVVAIPFFVACGDDDEDNTASGGAASPAGPSPTPSGSKPIRPQPASAMDPTSSGMRRLVTE